MPKFPWPPSVEELREIRPDIHTLRTGSQIARIYPRGGRHPTSWNAFRTIGPLPGSRFDHHVDGEQRGVFYGARRLTTCVAEVFQHTRVVDRATADRHLVAFRSTRAVRLLDLCGDWPTRAGASQAIASGPKGRAQAWARTLYDAYPQADGIWYPSSMHGGHPALVLFERAEHALPRHPDIDTPLTHPGLLPDLVRAANDLGYLLR